MKIAIPTDKNTLQTTVCMSFGRAPYFLIYDTDTKESIFLDNAAAAGSGGAGIKAAQTLADQTVDAVLVPRCGQNAADVFNAAGIPLYQTINDVLSDNLKAFESNELQPLANVHAGFHRHGQQ